MAQNGPESGAMDVMGEALAAVTGGLERVLDTPAKAIPVSAQKEAIELLRTLPARVELALNGKADKVERLNRETPEGEYKPMLAALTDPKKAPKPEARLKLVEKLERAFSAPYTMWTDRAFVMAGQLIPRRTWTTIFGPEPGTPSESELGAWWRCWDIARDPMVIVDRIADGTLITDEVTCLGQFYPGIKDKLSVAVTLGLATLRSKDPEWLPADVTQRTVECLLGFSPLSQELATQLQNAAAAARQGEADKQREGGPVNGPVIDGPELQTPTQRIANR
jgi:hypothetical protein